MVWGGQAVAQVGQWVLGRTELLSFQKNMLVSRVAAVSCVLSVLVHLAACELLHALPPTHPPYPPHLLANGCTG